MSINFTEKGFIFLFSILILSSVDIFAQTGDWETVTNSGIIHRHECGFTHSNGKFYLIGGRRLGIEKYTDTYDPSTGVWSHGTHQPPIELHHFQAASYNNKLYIIGAFTGGHPNETPVDKIYIYDPADDSWAEGGTIPADRRRGAAGLVVYNNKIYVVAGATDGHIGGNVGWLDEYDPATQVWTKLTDAPHARDHYQAVVSGDKLYLAGGRRSKMNWNATTSKYENADVLVYEVDVYNFSTNTWETYPNNIPTGRAGTASVVLNNELLVMGGESSSQLPAHNETEAMDLSAKTWRQLAALDSGRHATHALVYNNKVYIASGSKSRGGSSSSELNSMEVFSISGNPSNNLNAPSEINFGELVQNETKTLKINIINSSANNIIINGISLNGTNNDQFSVISPPSFPYTLAGAATLELQVGFDPTSLGMKSAEISIVHTGDNSPNAIALMGESVTEVASIRDKSILSSLIIYPNPSKEQMLLDNISGNITWRIMENSGRILKEGESNFNSKCVLDVSSLDQGIYILNIKDSENNTSRSVIIKKD